MLVALGFSVALWSALLVVASKWRLRARVGVATFAAVLVVVPACVFRYYHVPLDVQVATSALHAWQDVRRVLWGALPSVSLAVFVVTLAELALLRLAAESTVVRLLRGRAGRKVGVVVLAFGLVAFVTFGPRARLATPEVRAIHALGALTEPRVARAAGGVVTLPPIAVERPLPSVLFILTESVRAEDYVATGPDATAAASLAALERHTEVHASLSQMRAVSSYTALSLSALLTGRSQEGSREDILRSPSFFDVGAALRDERGRRPLVAYMASQSEEIFETKAVHAAAERLVTVETILGRPVGDEASLDGLPLDRQIVDRFVAELPTFSAASVVMLHLYATHAPYYFEDAEARFTPFDRVVAWSRMAKLRNAYKNAIVAQDVEVARAIDAFAAHAKAAGRPFVVVFTSDHGEAFGEHGAIHHGQNLYDEQLHVPAWVGASAGVFSPEQAANLRAHADAPVTHLDVMPTILDAVGAWDHFALRAPRSKMAGRSLLRRPDVHGAVPITNCTAMFTCPLDTWGILEGDHKLVAQRWDAGWGCFVVDASGERAASADDPACPRLRAASRRYFPRQPNGAPNL